ncbi:MAG TPA: 2-oxoglutarate dehydrogenase, E2 component, dihydrolipoamide succinyltransferase, partial [Nocardioides sp.]|nr:2-oxoglutarate dehydrogenase, E2 component, dihydrolipoamide succinyltransferase [Nocardioides sp.]
MATEVNLPELGESVTEGTVTRWLKQVGDEVAVDEPLLEVSTDKVDTEIPSPVAGTLLEIKANEDETVDVGAVLATIGAADESTGGGDGGGDSGQAEQTGQADQADRAAEQSEAAPEPQEQEQQQPESEEASSPDTPLDQEKVERGAAHDQAEQEATPSQPDEPTGATEPTEPTEPTEKDEAPRDEVAAATSGAAESTGGGEQTVVRLPELGESVTEGTVTRWLKQVGDKVATDEPLLEVSTDKVDTEIPAPAAGTLQEIKVNEDETVEVGAELAVIGSGAAPSGGAGQAAPTEAEQPEPTPEPEQPAEETQPQQAAAEPEPQAPPEAEQPAAQAAPEQPEPAAAAPSGGRDSSAYVTPLVRKMAAQHGVDLASIVGTGVGGRIRKQDVLDAAQKQGKDTTPTQPAAAAAAAAQPAQPAAAAPGAPVPSPLRGKTEPMTRLRKVIAQRMVESLHVSAQLTTVVEVDVTAISRLRDSVKADFAAREGVKLSFLPFFAKAAIDALKAHPSLNAAIDTEKGEVTYYDRENLSVAVDTERGLLTPVIKEAGDLSIAGLARKIADVAERT